MMSLARNASKVLFRLYEGQEDAVDEYGNLTGSPVPKYGELQTAFLTVSPNKGDASIEPFGTLTDYDRTMSTADTTCPISEHAVLWLDGKSTDEPHNYVVKKRAPWKNSIVFAIQEVMVDE